mmetsp:Transcript_118716/g.217504  ORF Transcript_118716/g.217504 Transcript_118716/m.217504 type:complete len:186 (-) Transcript_118716:50-607(-)
MLGVFCPIYPLKGCTLLVESERGGGLEHVVQSNVVYAVPAGPRVRIASLGELGGWSVSLDQSKKDAVVHEAVRLLPAMEKQIRSCRAVAGLRPFSADETPLVGRIPGFDNVFLNTGPGHTGWKCSGGFASLLASVIHSRVQGAQGIESLSSVEIGAVDMLDPVGRLGYALTGPRLVRSIRSWAIP